MRKVRKKCEFLPYITCFIYAVLYQPRPASYKMFLKVVFLRFGSRRDLTLLLLILDSLCIRGILKHPTCSPQNPLSVAKDYTCLSSDMSKSFEKLLGHFYFVKMQKANSKKCLCQAESECKSLIGVLLI